MELYDKRKVGVNGQVVLPEKLRGYLGISTGDELLFIDVETDGGVHTLKVKVVKGEYNL